MRIIQLLDALDFGDGVSNDVINLHKLLDEMNVHNAIYSKWTHEKVKQYRKDMEDYRPREGDCILYHFSGKSQIIDQVLGYQQTTVLRYHNVTPPQFFKNTNPQLALRCQEGLDQIKEYIHRFDYYCADSMYNAQDLISFGADQDVMDTLPIAMNLERLNDARPDKQIVEEMGKHPSILFVGRVAPNKKIEDILDVFENYFHYYNDQAYLYLVGNKEQSDSYTQLINDRLENMMSSDHVVMTGKVDEQSLYSYYQGADVFLCMSEHEGFCIPLLEAMRFGNAVIAYNAGAVETTMGSGGILLNTKSIPVVSGVLDELINNRYLKGRVLDAQNRHLEQFLKPAMCRSLSLLLTKWSNDGIATHEDIAG